MAPFISPSSSALTKSDFNGGIMQAEQAKGVITRFFTALAMSLSHVETYKVGNV